MLSSIKSPVPMVSAFEAQLVILELLEHNPIFTVGYRSVLHIHTIVEECEVTKLLGAVDIKTKETKKVGGCGEGGVGFRAALAWGCQSEAGGSKRPKRCRGWGVWRWVALTGVVAAHMLSPYGLEGITTGLQLTSKCRLGTAATACSYPSTPGFHVDPPPLLHNASHHKTGQVCEERRHVCVPHRP